MALTLTRYHIPESPAGGGPVQISLSEMQAWCVPKPDGAEEEAEAEAAEAAEAEGEVTSGPYVEISLLEVEGAGHLGHLGSP